jgi:predicted Fe-S protein YdhL (DUF1289 family)
MASPAQPQSRAAITPCVKVCVVDDESGLCLGCYRTIAEIARWQSFDDSERTALMAALPARRGRISAEKLGEA